MKKENDDLIVGAKAISQYIKIGITTLMKRIHYEDFPAFKIGHTGEWHAKKSKIDIWIEEGEQAHIEREKEEAEEKKKRGRPKKRIRPRKDGF